MAVSNEESKANYQSLIDAGITPEQISSYSNTNNFGPKLNAAEVNAIKTNFKVTGNPYSAENISATINNPTAAPDLSDPYGLYDKYFTNNSDIVGTKSEIKNINDQINQLKAEMNTQQTNIENTADETAAYIPGAMAKAKDEKINQLSTLNDQLLAKQSYLDTLSTEATNKYNIAVNERGKIQELISKTGGKAGISYTDTYDQAVSKADDYNTKQLKQQQMLELVQQYPGIKLKESDLDDPKKLSKAIQKQANKSAVTQLFASTFGYIPKGMSSKEMSKKLKKNYESEKAYQDEVRSLELQIKKKSLKGSGGTASGVLTSAASALNRGSGGFVDYADYKAQKDKAVKSGKVSSSQFDSQFSYMLSPDDQKSIIGDGERNYNLQIIKDEGGKNWGFDPRSGDIYDLQFPKQPEDDSGFGDEVKGNNQNGYSWWDPRGWF